MPIFPLTLCVPYLIMWRPPPTWNQNVCVHVISATWYSIEGLGAIRAQVKNFNISLQAKAPIFRMPRFNGLQIQVVHALG